MLDIKNGIRSLTEFKQDSTSILGYIKKTHNPTILTVNGRAQVVLLDPDFYQELVNKVALLESASKIKASLIEMENHEGIPAKKVFKKLNKKFTKKN